MENMRRFPARDCRRESGVAIVIILAFLVLLTGIAVAFFSRAITERQVSNMSASQAKADSLGRGALDVIVGDLKQEMAVASKVNANGGAATYLPLSKTYIVPTRSYPGQTAPDPLPNLIRESGLTDYAVNVALPTGTPAAIGVGSGAGAPATAVSSTTPATNGRKVSLSRWNSHYLLPRLTTNKTTSTNLDSTPASAFTAPSWVAVTKEQGPTVLSPSNPNADIKNNPVTPIGRYAYAVYDEGGLLDANVAGYPDPSALTAYQLGTKGLLAFADLTQLPTYNPAVVTTAPTFLPQAQVNSVVGWRNYATIQPTGALSAGYGFDANTWTRYLGFLTTPRDFLSVNPAAFPSPPAANSRTDQMFTSRQALLRFWNTLITNANGGALTDNGHLQDVLPYLGTFSRELNAPSWSPTTPAGSTIDYATQAETSSSTNRDLPNVLFTKAGTITRYRVDGTAYTKNVRAGDGVVQMRFPLGRIAWLNSTTDNKAYSPGPAPGIPADAIQRNFGLAWNVAASDRPHWDYVGPAGKAGAPVSAIETLDQVAQEVREPNFFELLKAGILSGSLGKTAADPTAAPKWKTTIYSWLDTARDDVNVDFQVLRIGANIIDQATPSPVPTEIQFSNNEVTPALIVSAFGIKSLPYIAWIPFVNHRPQAYPKRNMLGAYYAFEVWDPHQNSTLTPPAGSPTNFRIHPLQGKAALRYNNAHGNYVTLDTTQFINFTRDSGGGRTFSDLTLLTTAFASSGSPANICPITQPPILKGTPGAAPTVAQGYPGFVGFNVGELLDLPDGNITGVATDPVYGGGVVSDAVPSSWPSFEIQVQDPATSTWHPFQHIDYMIGSDAAGPYPANTAFQLLSSQVGMYNPDPRTERFGAFGGHGISNMGLVWTGTGGAGATMMYGTAQGNTIWGYSGGGPGWQYGSGAIGYPDSMLSYLSFNNTAAFASAGVHGSIYNDADGILREADCTLKTYPMYPLNLAGTSHASDRPLILNRPYRSVGELGYAFRDMPWKTVDFFSKNSADGALLDLFTVSEGEMTAGKLDLNTHNAPVLQTMLASAILKELPSVPPASQALALTGTTAAAPTANSQAAVLASALVSWTTNASKGPLLNRADLVPAFADASLGLTAANFNIKTQREAPIRALAEAGMTRTWNLLIDVVAQSGRYQASATSLDKFNVEGERRYWLHVAIDRFTGRVIDEQLESVYE